MAATADAAAGIFRDDGDGVRQALAREHARCNRDIDALAPVLAPVYAARMGRAAAGAVLVAGAVVLLLGALLLLWLLQSHSGPGRLTAMVLAPWPLAFLAHRLAHAWARRRFARCMRQPLAPTGDVHQDLARARHLDARRQATGLLVPLEEWSVSLPLAGLALLLPLTLHFLAFVLITGLPSSSFQLQGMLDEFDGWILMSMAIVGHCHLFLAIMGWRYGGRLAARPDHELEADRYQAGWRAYGITTLSSTVPGVLLIFIPVILVAMTGLVVPLIFARMNALVLRERAALHRATAPGRDA